MVLEFLNRQLEDVRAQIRQGLLDTRKRDRVTRDLQESLNNDEKQLLADLMSEIKRLRAVKNGDSPKDSNGEENEEGGEVDGEEGGVSFKDEPFQGEDAKEDKKSSSLVKFDAERIQERAGELLLRRQTLLDKMDDKIESVKSTYNFIEKKIKDFDSSTAEISHLLEGRTNHGKKKRKKTDPNEPLYCTCRTVFTGKMIACENTECAIEWFHFACVGLIAEPKNGTWYCPSCQRDRDDEIMAADEHLMD